MAMDDIDRANGDRTLNEGRRNIIGMQQSKRYSCKRWLRKR